MLLRAAFFLLVGSIAFAAVAADTYQHVVDAIAPGFEILKNEDLLQDESELRKFLSPDEIAKRKQRRSLGLIEGRLNNDGFPDFAAWVVNRSIKAEDPDQKGQFAARLVVCLGTNAPQKYRCEILPTLRGKFISLPYWADLELFMVDGEFQCGTADEKINAYYPEGSKRKRPASGVDELPATKLRLNYDAISENAIGTNFGRILVRRADGVYLDCADAD